MLFKDGLRPAVLPSWALGPLTLQCLQEDTFLSVNVWTDLYWTLNPHRGHLVSLSRKDLTNEGLSQQVLFAGAFTCQIQRLGHLHGNCSRHGDLSRSSPTCTGQISRLPMSP